MLIYLIGSISTFVFTLYYNDSASLRKLSAVNDNFFLKFLVTTISYKLFAILLIVIIWLAIIYYVRKDKTKFSLKFCLSGLLLGYAVFNYLTISFLYLSEDHVDFLGWSFMNFVKFTGVSLFYFTPPFIFGAIMNKAYKKVNK